MIVDVLMPKMGESITEGTIVEWKKNVGDTIEKDETLLEISTDKVDSEIPCSTAGKVLELLFNKNDTVEVNTIIAKIGTEGEDSITSKESTSISDKEEVKEDERNESNKVEDTNLEEETNKITSIKKEKKSTEQFYSPLVRAIAKKENISIEDLATIKGSGRDGRVNKLDILNYIDNKSSETTSNADVLVNEPAAYSTSLPSTEILKNEIEEMGRVRQRIADHMVKSKDISAHVYTTTEVDVTKIVETRNNKKEEYFNRHQVKLTYTPIIVSACIKAIQEFPLMNASIDGNNIVHHQNINMGVAVALPDNNLIVPVIKSSEEMNFLGLSRNINNYAKKARSNSLEPDEIFGSTFTITNPGIFGGLFGMPIINQPNEGILSVGSIEKNEQEIII